MPAPPPFKKTCTCNILPPPFLIFRFPPLSFVGPDLGAEVSPKKRRQEKMGALIQRIAAPLHTCTVQKKRFQKRFMKSLSAFILFFFFVTKKLYKKLKKALKNYDYWTLLICLDMVQKRYTLRQLLICLERGVLEVVLYGRGGNDSLVRKTGLPGWVEVGGNYTD